MILIQAWALNVTTSEVRYNFGREFSYYSTRDGVGTSLSAYKTNKVLRSSSAYSCRLRGRLIKINRLTNYNDSHTN